MANRITNPSPARKERSSMSIALAGASGSGKTMTALEIGTGLAGSQGRMVVIDTEGRRALHYARRFKFDHVPFDPPFNPERCTQAIRELQSDGYDVIIFDSASDEYEGQGGLQEMADAEGAWIKTKARHKHNLIRHLRNCPGTVIFCLRAEEKVKVVKENGRTVFQPQGWLPICEKRFMYDMTVSMTLSPETPGMPRFDLPRKIGADFVGLFQKDKLIDRIIGEKLRAWALDVDAPFVPSGGSNDEDVKPSGTAMRWKWLPAKGDPIHYRDAGEWQRSVCGSVQAIKDDARLREALDRNVANLNGMMAEFPDETAAIFKAFGDRGIMAGGQLNVAIDEAPKELG